MKVKKVLKIKGSVLDKKQLEEHLEKVATNHNLSNRSDKSTYPVPQMLESFKVIQEVYNLLSEHVKLGISIHPAGEWLLDNLYIIEETVKQIEKELTLKKYTNFIGISNGTYKGFARIYVLASEIVAFTDNKIEKNDLEDYLRSYQSKRSLSMEEIWNIGLFLQIAIIENIREICEKIYSSQIQKYKAENIAERLIENKTYSNLSFKKNNFRKIEKNVINDIKYSFVEYMSYILKRYGKKGNGYLVALEEVLDMAGTNVSEVIKKEHFDIAVKKVSIGNSITSIKKIQRTNFLEIFENINGVEELLKKDPAKIYEKMDNKTKDCYRNKIKEISKKVNISEIFISKKILELAEENSSSGNEKESHIGYYLIDKGIDDLYKKLKIKKHKKINNDVKTKLYIVTIYGLTVLLSGLISIEFGKNTGNRIIAFLTFMFLLIPVSELVIQVVQYILGKIVKPKLIPKLDFTNGIPEEYTTMVVIPTILNSKEKVKEIMRKLEVYYLANKSSNIYFTLLGDCTESSKKDEEFDEEIIEEGTRLVKKLNEKYIHENVVENKKEIDKPIFNFIYRERTYNEKEGKYLGWERKRGMLNQFNEYLLGNISNPFRVNTITDISYPPKYIITLDSDTDLILNSAFKLVGAMAHVLNKPILNKNNIVVEGYGILQPRVGINLDISYKSIFTKIFAGAGGIDLYSNAISDIYQDNFGEGIFTGKGIYDLEIFSKVLKNQIPENIVLSHDLLEGNYLRCGLVTDVLLMDGYPTKYNSFINRLSRWIRGDWQIIQWLSNKKKINLLSKYKIFDNLRRSLLEISIVTTFLYFNILGIILHKNVDIVIFFLLMISIVPFVLEILNNCIFKKQGEERQKTFTPKIAGNRGSLYRAFLILGCIPNKAIISLISISKALYRLFISHKNLLEWTTSEDAEKMDKVDLMSYYKQMWFNVLLGTSIVLVGYLLKSLISIVVAAIWIVSPMIMCYISRGNKKVNIIEKLDKKDKDYLYEISQRTWDFFNEYLNKENNYLIPDNYQEDRKNKIVDRTSSTNIGLSLLSVISAYDFKFIDINKTLEMLENIINTIDVLEKWNGHLYNWYNTKTKDAIYPRYVSTVDSGNFVGYLYVVKSFLIGLKEKEIEEIEDQRCKKEKIDIIEKMIKIIVEIINKTDFSILYNLEQEVFSIGFNVEENSLTDSYYDLLASEARQASLIAIAKKDIPAKHWNYLSKTLTTVGKYKGLISWSGTAFEYLMPNINIPKYEGSLLDESCKFMIMSQMQYSKKLNLPWGISEAAFSLKDLHSNYQYKAFGIPWLGLKRGLADEMVVSSYGSILAITDLPKEVIENLRVLEKQGMYNKYGFYESIDYTPERVSKGMKYSLVKTYMAHHQALILLSINNLFNNNIMQKRFMKNPEMEAVSILLQETMPEKAIITKEKKEKIEKLNYTDYENYLQKIYKKIDERLITGNVISSNDYSNTMNQKGEGFSKYKGIYVNRYKKTDDYPQGIFFYFKNIKTKKVWTSSYTQNENKDNEYTISFMPDKQEQEMISGNIKTNIVTTISCEEAVELRRVTLKNMGDKEEIIEITSSFEPVLSKIEQDYAHPIFNNLFLTASFDEITQSLVFKRRTRTHDEEKVYLASTLSTDYETIGDLEYEIDQEKFIGRGNLRIPYMVENSIPLSKKIGLVTEPISALRRTVKIMPKEEVYVDLIISIGEEKEKVLDNLKKYKIMENVKKELELSKVKVEAESRYLGIKGKDVAIYQKMLSYIIFDNSIKSIRLENMEKRNYKQSELWKYGISGDLPIILVRIQDVNDSYVIEEVLKAYEFFKIKNIEIELVIVDEEKYSYQNYVREEIENCVLNKNMGYLKNIKGGIFILSKNEILNEDFKLLEFISTIVIDSKKGTIINFIKEMEEEYLDKYKQISNEIINNDEIQEEKEDDINILKEYKDLKYFNEYGAFSNDGKEYLIKTSDKERLPTVWSHILANDKFGTVVTESMGGYSWYKNSRLDRITSWHNKPTIDIPSEIIYLKDIDNNRTWSIGLNPMPDNNNYNVIYGFGYCKYIHKSDGIEQELEIFVPKEDSCKVNILTLKNTLPNKKKLKLYYYIKPVIGEDEIKTDENININFDKNNNIICAKNLYKEELEDLQIYVSSSEQIKSYTGDKNFFLGKGGIKNPQGIRKVSLNNENSLGKNSCIAVELEVELESFSEKQISIVLGAEEQNIDCKNVAYKYRKISNCKHEEEIVKNYWSELLR